jgi:cytochrome c553
MNQFLSTLSLALVACMTVLPAAAQDIKGDAKAGAAKNAMCIGCHSIEGYQASFPEVYKVPKISGQNEQYIVAALSAYKTGERRHPSMRGIAESLSEQDMADLGAYYAASGASAAAPTPAKAPVASDAVEKLLAKGNCAACHGVDLNAPSVPSYPKIAGQYGDYLFVALKSYKVEGNAKVGRNNAVMGTIAKQFTHAELKLLANHVSKMPGTLKVVPQSRFR